MSAHRLALALALAGVSCRVPNEEHCLHRAADANLWCEENEKGLAFCSPCEAEHHGCVEDEPTKKECPEYSVPSAEETGTGTDTESDGDTTTGG